MVTIASEAWSKSASYLLSKGPGAGAIPGASATTCMWRFLAVGIQERSRPFHLFFQIRLDQRDILRREFQRSEHVRSDFAPRTVPAMSDLVLDADRVRQADDLDQWPDGRENARHLAGVLVVITDREAH